MNREKKLFNIVFALLFVSSFSLLLSFFGSYENGIFEMIIAYLVGILFWGGIIAGYAIFVIISKNRKKDSEKIFDRRKGSNRPGIVCFFSNKQAAVFDLVMCASLVLTIVFSFIPVLNKALSVVFMAILFFSIHMHCILNGVNYRYINYK